MQTGDLHAVILAGGLGTRLRRVLAGKPKPMVDVAGRPFLEWVLRYLRGQGCRRASLSSGYQSLVIADHFQSQPVEGMRIDCFAEPEPLGTAGGFRHTVRQLAKTGNDPAAWLVVNGDSLFLSDLPEMLARWQGQATPAAILARQVDDVHRFGKITFDDRGRLLGFAEKTAVVEPGAQPGWINAGVYLLQSDLWRSFPEPRDPAKPGLSFEYDVFPGWVRAGLAVAVLTGDAPFLDIGTEETLAQAEAFVRQHRTYFP